MKINMTGIVKLVLNHFAQNVLNTEIVQYIIRICKLFIQVFAAFSYAL